MLVYQRVLVGGFNHLEKYEFVNGKDDIPYYIYIWLVVSTPLKNMSSSVGMIFPNIWKNKKCSKPPTRYGIYMAHLG